MRNELTRKKFLGIILLAAAVCVIYSWRLNFPTEPYFDEVHDIKFLKILIHEHKIDHVSPHPPLWSLLTWPCVALFGEYPAVWRMVSLLAGLLLIPCVYIVGKKITRNATIGLLAAFFFAFDCVSLTQARIAMFNSLALLFAILSLWAFLNYGLDRLWPRRKALMWAGIFLGLALSSKLSSFSIIPVIAFLLIHKAIKSPEERKALFFESILFLGIVPVAIYFAAHAFIPFLPGYSWSSIWEIQKFNFQYHFVQAKTQTHQYSSQWWGWPLMLRPTWYYFTSNSGVVNGIIAVGNPAIFWMIPAMAVYLFWGLVRHKNKVSGLIVFGYLSQWLFYASIARLKFFHYIYIAMPFVAIGLGLICAQLWAKGKVGKFLVCAYLALVLGMFIYWYPLLTGLPISDKYYQHHMWFRSWI